MDKEKQIEEIATIMCNNEISCADCFSAYEKNVWKTKIKDKAKHCEIYRYAQNLVKKGYRKITENEVVISKEEKQKLLKEMYNQGKFDAIADLEKDGKVVISKEEYASLKHFEKRVRGGVCLTQKEWFDFCNEDSNRRTCLRIEEREKERKETARGILLKIKEVKTQDCGYTDWLDDTFFGDEFMKLAKQYGVEIGEVK